MSVNLLALNRRTLPAKFAVKSMQRSVCFSASCSYSSFPTRSFGNKNSCDRLTKLNYRPKCSFTIAIRYNSTESETLSLTFKRKDGSLLTVYGKEGDNILRLAQRNDIELEGACEGVCACSTCHVIVEDEVQ